MKNIVYYKLIKRPWIYRLWINKCEYFVFNLFNYISLLASVLSACVIDCIFSFVNRVLSINVLKLFIYHLYKKIHKFWFLLQAKIRFLEDLYYTYVVCLLLIESRNFSCKSYTTKLYVSIINLNPNFCFMYF